MYVMSEFGHGHFDYVNKANDNIIRDHIRWLTLYLIIQSLR
jgi:hypothetical protein